jgi:DNA polymerase I-like protein with 3'-5' exonuclease and polymerase domains/uracil-DNA glycosylase
MTPRKVGTRGPATAPFMIVGEAPGRQEVTSGVPFVGASGQELNRMLGEAGISPASCFFTNVVKYMPPGRPDDRVNGLPRAFFPTKAEGKKHGLPERFGRHISPEVVQGLSELEQEITHVRPQGVLALGNTALWALSGGRTGVGNWRGSCLWTREFTLPDSRTFKARFLPTYHPASVLRQWSQRREVILDLKRFSAWTAGEIHEPAYNFILRPSAQGTLALLESLSALVTIWDDKFPLSIDIETRGHFMACVALAWSKTHAISIPFMCVEGNYFSPEEERLVRAALRRLLTHPNVLPIFQNGMYDIQYFLREDGYFPTLPMFDTMLAQHALFPGTPKSLDYLASLYCEHYSFWKNERKEWDPRVPEEEFWSYNCKDAVYTYEVWEMQRGAVEGAPAFETLTDLFPPTLAMTVSGFRMDNARREQISSAFAAEMEGILARLEVIFEHPVNPRSNKQLQTLFYGDFNFPVRRHRKTGNPTLNEETLEELKKRAHPIWEHPIDLILAYRQAGVIRSSFLEMNQSPDGRFHPGFNLGGTETFRFSSSSNAHGEGTNAQNWSPTLRRLLIPDEGYVFLEGDLDRADAQVVAWEAGDEELKQIFREGHDIHTENARTIFGQVTERTRHLAKSGVHAVNYFCHARTLGITLGITVREAERFITKWLGAHPGIQGWHRRVEMELKHRRRVTNKFGFHRMYFDRVDTKMLQAALAWIPQSTVAIVIHKGLLKIYKELPEIALKQHGHDSLLMQVPSTCVESLLPEVDSRMRVVIPYDDPLTIPVSFKVSPKSWGDMKPAEPWRFRVMRFFA